MTDFDPIEDAAQFLASLRRLRMRGDALPVASRPETYDQALDVQDRIVELACAPVIGWKIGCTSRAAQDYLGIPHPFPGRVFGDTTFDSPAALPADMFTQRGIGLPPLSGPRSKLEFGAVELAPNVGPA